MKVAFFLSGLGAGGIYNQTKGLFNLIKNLELNKNDQVCIITDENNISLNLGIDDLEIIFFKKTFLNRIMFRLVEIIKKNRLISREFILNPFQKFLKRNKIDLLIFSQPSFYSLYCDGVQFIINIWNTEIKKYYNLKEFITGNYEYQNRIINFSVEKAFKIIVFTEKNKDKDYLKIFNNLNLNSEFKWFFYPAQFWPHKNHKYLLDVMKDLIKKNYHKIGFVFCGPDKGNLNFIKETIKKENLDENIKILGFISDEDIISIYKNCTAIVMPTLLGRSSLPLAEGLFFKKKIFYSNGILDDRLKKYVEEFQLDNPVDLSNKILRYIDRKETNSIEINYDEEFGVNNFKKNYENAINNFRKLLRKWRAV
jgi:glycosyltransferase involved in cell wall biosynthesis